MSTLPSVLHGAARLQTLANRGGDVAPAQAFSMSWGLTMHTGTTHRAILS